MVETPCVTTAENIFAILEISKQIFVVKCGRQLRTGSYEDCWMVLTTGLFTNTISNWYVSWKVLILRNLTSFREEPNRSDIELLQAFLQSKVYLKLGEFCQGTHKA